MIEISIQYVGQDKRVQSIECSGHAEYEDRGKDIVCAGVSAILIGGINAIDCMGLIQNIHYEVKESGFISIQVKKEDKKLDIVLDTIVYQLFTIEESYTNYVSIMEV